MELLKGQKVKLTDLTQDKKFQLDVFANMNTGSADISCFGVDGQGRLSDDRYFVFYNQLHTPENAITLNCDGTGSHFSVDLGLLPSTIKKLVVTVSADEGASMQNLDKGQFALSAGGQILAAYPFTGGEFTEEKAIILCELYEKDGVWRISVVANGFKGGLSALLAHFGGEEAAPSPAPAPKPNPAPAPAPSNPSGQGSLAEKAPLSPTPGPAPKPEPAPAPASSGPISLRKSGDSHKISLTKNAKEIHVNLNWNTGADKKGGLFSAFTAKAVDLDLACMFRLKTGEKGVIQALGNAFGSANMPPYIFLDQDDRTGASANGENMWFKRPELIDFAIVFAYIYEGTPNWGKTNARVLLQQQGGQDILIHIDNQNNRDRFCVIASLSGNGDQLEVRREERFFAGHIEVDKAYGFGFRWKAGRK